MPADPAGGTMPNPGSFAAVKRGCRCPRMDNNHGYAYGGIFVTRDDCPLHGLPTIRALAREKEGG